MDSGKIVADGRVAEKSKVLQEVLADLKSPWAQEFLLRMASHVLGKKGSCPAQQKLGMSSLLQRKAFQRKLTFFASGVKKCKRLLFPPRQDGLCI